MEKERIRIIESFSALLGEKPFDSITQKAVTERADLPASAFSYCFHDMYALADALLEEERNTVAESGITPDSGGEAFLLSVSFALRNPAAAKNLVLSSAAGIYKKSVSILASKYFSEVILKKSKETEPGEMERSAVRFLRASAVGLASKELIRADDVRAEAEKYIEFFDIFTDNLQGKT